ncbi:MAG: hypothetical protein AAGA99_21625 [Actinomycetota bacterium]
MGSAGGKRRERNEPLEFAHPKMRLRFDQDDRDRATEGLGFGRWMLRIVTALVIVACLVLLVIGRSDAAQGVGVMVLAPLVVVAGLVELLHSTTDNIWGED